MWPWSPEYAAWCVGLHFLSSGFVGLAVYYLTGIIFPSSSAYRWRVALSILCSVLFHVLEDAWLSWF